MLLAPVASRERSIRSSRFERDTSLPVCLVFAAGLFIRLTLILLYPAVYGGDSVIHLNNSHRILLSSQLPLLQCVLFLTHCITDEPFASRVVMALIGAFAGVAFYFFATIFVSRKAALWASLFFVTNPFLNEISILPFQEVFMLGLLCFGLYFYFTDRLALAGICLGLSCLTRYEPWILVPVLAFDYWKRHTSLRSAVLVLLIFAWAPLLWIAAHLGLSNPGTFVIEWPRSISRLVRWIYLAWITAKYTPVTVLLLACLGIYFARLQPRRNKRGLSLLFVFGTLFLCSILFSAHGTPHPGAPDPERFVTSREATLPIVFVLLASALGLEYLSQRNTRKLILNAAIGCSLILGALQSAQFIRLQTSRPEVQISYQLASYINTHIPAGTPVLILARPFTAGDFSLYLQKAEQLEGREGLQKARRNLSGYDLSPIDFQRTLVQCRPPKSRLHSIGDPNGYAWTAIWSDTPLPAATRHILKAFSRVASFRQGTLTVDVYHRETTP